MPAFPPRIHCLLARENPRIGVVIRRGPSKSVCTILWDRRSDTFQLGQWMRGRIYERRSDISPDGHHMIYFAMNGRWSSGTVSGQWSSKTLGSWTAISRVPYLKAVVLRGKGDCWNGGGLFTSPSRFWLNHEHWESEEFARFLKTDRRLQPDLEFKPTHYFGGECPQVYYHRLMRDSWRMRGPKRKGVHAIFEKPVCSGVLLRKLCFAESGAPPGLGSYYDRHELVDESGTVISDHPEWQWADFDRKRIVWAEGGKLFAGNVNEGGLTKVKELHDFSDMQFQAIEAPY